MHAAADVPKTSSKYFIKNRPHPNCPIAFTTFFVRDDYKNLSSMVERFWQVEEYPTDIPSSKDTLCEKHFTDNTLRNNDGRFILKRPPKADNIGLDDSIVHAKQRFLTLERKFNKNPNLKDNYAKFINEYQVLGHMSLFNSNDRLVDQSKVFYIPHHAVFKDSSLTTKIRVVFDGSAKTTNGLSLNDTLLVGPTIHKIYSQSF